jgi:ABC-type transport system substrate-binding protein
VQQLLRPYGIQIDLRTLESGRATSAIFRRAEPYPLTARADWSFDDPDRTLFDTFHSRGQAEHQGIGEAYPESRDLDQLLERQRQELNHDVRRSIVAEVQRRLVDDAIQTWLVSPGSLTAIPPWVGNAHVMLGGPGTSYRLTGTVYLKSGPRSA